MELQQSEIKNIFDEILKMIKPSSEFILYEELNKRNLSLAKTILFMCYKIGTKDYEITINDLSKFFKYSLQRARTVINQFENYELIKKVGKIGKENIYAFCIDEYGNYKITNYFNTSRTILGIKFGVKFEDEIKKNS